MADKKKNGYGFFKVKGEPEEVTEIRDNILKSFSDLVFDEGPHKYYLNGEELPSITTVMGRYEHEKDWNGIASGYAEKNGYTAEYWLDKWKFNNLIATQTGTLVHEFGESMAYVRNGLPELITESCKVKYYKEKNWLIPTRNKEKAIITFWDDMPDCYHFVLAEAKVYTNKNPKYQLKQPMAGTFDLLMYYKHPTDDAKSGLIIMDYKNNGSLTSKYNMEKMVMMLPPFDNFVEQAKSVYTGQLSCYQIPLEDLGYKVLGRKLIWVKDDGTYEKIDVPDVTKLIRENF